MKNKINKFLLVLFLVMTAVTVSVAQPPRTAPDPLANPGNPTSLSSTNNAPMGSPVPDGGFILLFLAALYGGFKFSQARKQVKTA